MSALSSGACDVQLLLDAEFYVALHRGTPHDIGYYQRVSQDAPHVLELGCGDGRVLRQLRQKAGAPQCLVGIDEHPGMLALARRGLESYGLCSCEFVQGDIRQFDLSARFERILLPYSTLWCLTDRDKLACLRCAVRHLAPGGSLHADLYVADDLLEIPDDARDTEREEELDDREFLVELGVRTGRYRVFEEDRISASRARVVTTFDFELISSPHEGLPQHHRQVIIHHPMDRRALRGLLREAGLRCTAETDARGGAHDVGSGAQLFIAAVRA